MSITLICDNRGILPTCLLACQMSHYTDSGRIKETLFIQELQPSLNASVGSERLLLY